MFFKPTLRQLTEMLNFNTNSLNSIEYKSSTGKC